MKGKLVKQENKWYVQYKMDSDLIATDGGLIPLNPYDVNQIEEDSKRFDNIEARIAAYPDVNFRIEDHWETGLEEVIKVAVLIPDTQSESLDFLSEQAQKLDMGYGMDNNLKTKRND